MKKTLFLLLTILFAITANAQDEVVGTTFIQPTVGLTDDYGSRDNMSSNLHSSNLTMSAITIGYRFNFKNH